MAAIPEAIFGVWELDKNKSDSSEEILVAQDVGWAKRKIINNSGVTMTITGSGAKCNIKQETTFTTNENSWELGVEREIDNPIIGKAKATMTVEGEKLHLIMNGEKGPTIVDRWVEGGEMINMTTFGEIKMKRYFVKK
mmetsp:Transcript_1683/g.2287  ORF Transcript_1683/g.2287 Transcript_1683/m.2287 type:complete len:138 (-) Transcript_1683:36-449(-)|eukprot:CAMPEP_0201475650 /NCGR_PEP_ID=MMETSP0151_2-20130828/1024_1 /ASSEMBLY_ACC=CAM_ASM_000257 /TAXON_ID=200890 /ORGANISM="Paramoeba atlantica, Strain 621/1 / CCAP 1560/9" /LENGTH=137 /DNA_ID=CAMNT_0047855797 /DNA_START=80 /DNA_END=493 /DNA_ORIENTATION=+